ncbi:MAG TPA: CRISPR-associated endonuclease Cas1 [Candidatus Sulfotelmatobacter sp.]|nr:CRISPR-associated endonuclease Cas1 [Candidatus Sulfotelmatobacter sp.]
MAASGTLPQPVFSRKSPIGRRGVLTLSGFGIKIRMQGGHLDIEDGIGPERRTIRLARIGHNLKRLVCISEDGFATLAALKWISDVGASFVMLNRNGKVLFATGPNAPSDVRLRRAQAVAHTSGSALRIARELIDQKLAGQEQVARHKLTAPNCAEKIHCYRSELAEADDLNRIRLIESRAAAVYWSAWRALPVVFPTKDQPRVPAHWRAFGTRVSPLTGSPRLAVNPGNAILNYLYSLLESEARLAATALGLDPGLGVLHVDTKARDSLACDLMETARPQVDAYLLDWITREPLRRQWFFEMPDGNCRLTALFTAQLSETAPMWGRAVAPFAEWVTRALWSSSAKLSREPAPPTRLTQRTKREVKGSPPSPPRIRAPKRANLCPECGKTIDTRSAKCADCYGGNASERMTDVARIGRETANSPEARKKHAITARRNALAQHAWKPSDQPAWLSAELFTSKIQPLLTSVSMSAIRSSIGVSKWYASKIRQGYRPHPRHWRMLAELIGVSQGK